MKTYTLKQEIKDAITTTICCPHCGASLLLLLPDVGEYECEMCGGVINIVTEEEL